MGQALRRATTSSSRVSSPVKNIQKPPPPQPPAAHKVELKSKTQSGGGHDDPIDQDGISRTNLNNVLEEKDTGYDAMLSQMVGRIRAKPGGKPEMGEALVVEKYDRPMPKLRNTKPESNYDVEKLTPPGTLNVAQLRQILQLYQGESNGHNGPMDLHKIAERFRVHVTQVQKIVQFVSLPPENRSSKQQDT